jgi:hypothetical protein
MNHFKKMGGVASLILAACYLVGFAVYGFILDYSGVVEALEKVAFFVDNQATLTIATMFVYVVFGIFLVVLALALYERLKNGAPALAQTATVFGLLWAGVVIASGLIFNSGMGTVVDLYGTDQAQAATVWLAIDAVFEGLGGGTEILGGIWMLLVSWAALRAGEFPKVLNYLGLVIGVLGILTIIPALEALTDVFGLTQIVWFVWLGIVLLRNNTSEKA